MVHVFHSMTFNFSLKLFNWRFQVRPFKSSDNTSINIQVMYQSIKSISYPESIAKVLLKLQGGGGGGAPIVWTIQDVPLFGSIFTAHIFGVKSLSSHLLEASFDSSLADLPCQRTSKVVFLLKLLQTVGGVNNRLP